MSLAEGKHRNRFSGILPESCEPVWKRQCVFCIWKMSRSTISFLSIWWRGIPSRFDAAPMISSTSGSLIGEREPYDIDMDAVISAARKAGCHLEINAEPDRLDLNDFHAHAAKLAGVKLAVSTDAHSIDAFQCMRFGIDQARRAWLTASDVLNTRPLAELRKLLKR